MAYAKLEGKPGGSLGAAWLDPKKVRGLSGAGTAVAGKELYTEDQGIIAAMGRKGFRLYDKSEGDTVYRAEKGPIVTEKYPEEKKCSRCGHPFRQKGILDFCPVCAEGSESVLRHDPPKEVLKFPADGDIEDEICEVCESVFIKDFADQKICNPCQGKMDAEPTEVTHL